MKDLRLLGWMFLATSCVTTDSAGPRMLGEFDPKQNYICLYSATYKVMKCMSPEEFAVRWNDAENGDSK